MVQSNVVMVLPKYKTFTRFIFFKIEEAVEMGV